MAEVGGIDRVSVGVAVRARAAGAAFAMPAGSPPAGVGAALGATCPAVSLSGLIVLQDAEPPRDRAARRRGQDILAALAELQRGLLGGEEGGALSRLASLIGELPQAADPRLGSVLAAVALRARIELARRGAESRSG